MVNRTIKQVLANKTASNFIGSGFFKSLINLFTGIVVLRWIDPLLIGEWHSITVFTGYTLILTFGITSGLNRELPYHLGKGDVTTALNRLKSSEAYILIISIALFILGLIVTVILLINKWIEIKFIFMINSAILLASLNLLTNHYGATYRSNNSFNKLARIQWIIGVSSLILVPLVYFWGIEGFIIGQVIIALSLLTTYFTFRPFKIRPMIDLEQLKILIKIGGPMYALNYLAVLVQSFPKLMLVLFSTPLVVGLFAPGITINKALNNLPIYVNRYVFPKLSYSLGKNFQKNDIIKKTFNVLYFLIPILLLTCIIVSISLPFIITKLFPKYIDGIDAAQIIVFFVLFNSVYNLFQNTVNALLEYKYLFIMVLSKLLIYLFILSLFALVLKMEILIAASLGLVVSEAISCLIAIIQTIQIVKK